MQHLDPGSISMAALNESLDAPSEEHLAGCERCAAEVRELNLVVVAAQGDTSRTHLESPDPQVWEAIHRELGLQPSLLPDPLTADRSTADPWSGDAAATPAGQLVTFTPRGPGPRTFTTKSLVAAVSIGVLTGAGAFWAAQMLGTKASPGVVAQADLAPLDGYTAQGSAEVLSADGARTLRITLTEEQADGYQEVWLIAPDLQQMYSLGVLGEGTGSLAIPDSVDLAAFPIVDVSDEPLDGDPAHSGVSVIRGSLAAATG
ncbi:anti-sigma factor [Arthrobacter sp. Br18]|uniref:anti-sigma factor domain-containing protein n=1 Tax=Arthrobacter sp. Br18 TaxID=1312954 RepID=UPI00047CE9C2|nr:anti-sigma factor [Arthrobacter sp. Br18]